MTGNLNANNNKLTNLAHATAASDAVRWDQVILRNMTAGGDLTVRTGRPDNPRRQRHGREDEVQETHGDDQAGTLSNGHSVDSTPRHGGRGPLSRTVAW